MNKICLLVAALCLAGSIPVKPVEKKVLARIAFGSCSRQDITDQLWAEVMATQPDLWIWLGDNIYGDSPDPSVLKKKYDQQKSHPDYQKLIASVPVVGVWDDHDYGINDGGKEFGIKKESRELMLEFLDIPKNDPVRKHEGAYTSYRFGGGNKKVKVILLDTRYFRDSLRVQTKPLRTYLPNESGDVLGAAQWTWLESELRKDPAALTLIGSSIQVLSEEHRFEKWSNFPAARKRLLELIVKTQPGPVLFLSGDRHIAEVSKMTLEGYPYPVYDFTSSGLTHTWNRGEPEPNRYREGLFLIKKNFGLIEIDWQGSKPALSLQVRGHADSVFQDLKVVY
jgi:alkaline phosphatase D